MAVCAALALYFTNWLLAERPKNSRLGLTVGVGAGGGGGGGVVVITASLFLLQLANISKTAAKTGKIRVKFIIFIVSLFGLIVVKKNSYG